MRKYLSQITSIIIILLFSHIYATDPSLSVVNNRNMIIIGVESQTHIDYGLSYPITYEFTIPDNIENLKAYKKFQSGQNWESIEKKTEQDFFNGIEAVRFDYDQSMAFLSIGFSSISDSIFIKITDINDNDINTSYHGTSEYYDNRSAAVTITADDWADYCNDKFIQACQNFRSYNLWYSVAIISEGLSSNSWDDIQTEIDLGLVEPVSHSRTHPYIPYIDVESEVLGSKQDIFDNLDLVGHNSSGENEYIYAWVAPYGNYDSSIDTMTSVGKYLISRMFNWDDNDFSEWDDTLNKFYPIGASIEVGSSDYWGSTNINELNNTFDNVVETNGIYHLMTHPNILEWDEDFTSEHLEHISNRKDIWYVGFGHLYLYRFLQNAYTGNNSLDINPEYFFPKDIKLIQNFPNPFNPVTNIEYELRKDSFVNIIVYDVLGKVVNNLVNKNQSSGYKSVQWDATNNQGESVSAGVYLYNIQAGDFNQTKKMILLK